MSAGNQDLDARDWSRELLTAGASAELRLIKDERKAERRLAEALAALVSDEARVRKAQQRLERSRDAFAAAEASLREFQSRRAAGPIRIQD